MGKVFDAAHIARLLAEARASKAAPDKIIDPEVLAHLEEPSKVGQIIAASHPVENLDYRSASVDQIKAAVEAIEPTRKVMGVARDDITYNKQQQEFIDRALAGENLVLIGAAGTGKTTCQRGFGKALINQGKIKPLSRGTKWLKAGVPGIAVVSFTNKAVNNIRHALPDDIKPHALTIHKLLEFAPVWYEVDDPANPGQFKKTVRFEPARNRYNPLPSDLKAIVFEESSMVDVPLFDQLMQACPHKPQLIFLGDIQQLPPVFGSSILGFKMLELPIVELTEVYRQAANSPIIDLAWKLLAGKPKVFDSKAETIKVPMKNRKTGVMEQVSRLRIPALAALTRENEDGRVVFQPWQKQLSADNGLLTATKQFCEWSDTGYYNPNDDIILCPFNVSFGTIEINRGISQHLGRKRRAIVYEVIAGVKKHYLAEGDRVLYEKEDAFITRIVFNGEYLAKSPQTASEFLDRWGHLRTEDMDADKLGEHEKTKEGADDFDLEAIEKFIEAAAADDDERVTAASHNITLEIAATGEEVELTQAGEVNNLLGGYCITIHKSQGSEWSKVFLLLHHSHATMNQRELLYTAVTRAKKHLHIICEPSTFEKGVVSQKIQGNTLKEKAEFFKGKVAEREKQLFKMKEIENSEPAKLAFALVEQWDSLARDAVNHWWEFARKLWPEKIKDKKAPNMSWRVKGAAAGLASPERHEVFFSPVYLHIDPTDMIADTVPHEVAHIVAPLVFGNIASMNHGRGWQDVMRKFGRDPVASKFHKLGDLPAALKTFMEESKAEDGQHPDEEE